MNSHSPDLQVMLDANGADSSGPPVDDDLEDYDSPLCDEDFKTCPDDSPSQPAALSVGVGTG
jgi:hypothetical protein